MPTDKENIARKSVILTSHWSREFDKLLSQGERIKLHLNY